MVSLELLLGCTTVTGTMIILMEMISRLIFSVMIIPGLARLGYAHEEVDRGASDSDISQFNAWIAYNPNDLTLAFEFDNFEILDNDEYWSMMLLANYQFTDWFAGTIRYAHEDYEKQASVDPDANSFTFALLFSLTNNFFLNVEYSITDVDSSTQGDYNEFFIERFDYLLSLSFLPHRLIPTMGLFFWSKDLSPN